MHSTSGWENHQPDSQLPSLPLYKGLWTVPTKTLDQPLTHSSNLELNCSQTLSKSSELALEVHTFWLVEVRSYRGYRLLRTHHAGLIVFF